jgi:hypothetical protein
MKKNRRQNERGAVMVEAAIVIATFILFMLGIIFFYTLYVKQIQTMSLARSTVIAYSMAGCPPSTDPGAWLARDLNPGTAQSNPAPATNHAPVGASTAAQGSNRAGSIMSELPGAGSDEGALNPIARLGLSGSAAATTKTGVLSARKGFRHTVGGTSFVSCGDKIRKGDFSDVYQIVKSKFSFTKNEPPDN